jgi:hypothetical protein
MLKKALIALAVLLAGFLVFAAMRPDTYHVERSIVIEAPPRIIYMQLDDLRVWSEWSPWDKIDPGMKKTYEGTARTVGASYTWQGNDDVGKGKMTITEREIPSRIAYRLEFIEPFAAVAKSGFTLREDGDKTHVTWFMDGENAFVSKVFGVFMNMDAMIGADFEKGLAALKVRSLATYAQFKLGIEMAQQQVRAEQASKAAKQGPDAGTAATAP